LIPRLSLAKARNFILSLLTVPFMVACIADVNEPLSSNNGLLIFSTSSSPSDQINQLDFGATAAAPGRSFETIFLINSGGKAIDSIKTTLTESEFVFEGGNYPGIGGDCAEDLAPGEACSIVLRFNPPTTTSYTGELNITYGDSAELVGARLDLKGQGTNPALLTVSETDPYDYGQQPLNTSGEHVFTISNVPDGAIAKRITEVALNPPYELKGGEWPGLGGTCTDKLLPGNTCSFVVTFTPTVVGPNLGEINVQYDNGITQVSADRDLTGVGVIPANLVIDMAPVYDFGTLIISQNATFTFTVTNAGGLNATSMTGAGLVFPFNFTGGSYPGAGGDCGSTLTPSATCTIEVQFTPINPGSFTSTLEIPYNNGAVLDTATRDIQGAAVTPALLTISDGPTLDFGVTAIGSSLTHAFTVTNSGGSQATSILDSGALAPPFDYSGVGYPGIGGDCNVTLAPGASCTLVLEFSPTVANIYNDQLEISYNDGLSGQLAQRDIQGTGVIPATLTITESDPYNYGSIPTGGFITHTFTVSNTGGFSASGLAEVGLTAPFEFSGGAFPGAGGDCTTTLLPGDSCTLEINFSPTVTGLQQDTIALNYFDGATNQTVNRDIEGSGVTPASLSINEAPIFDYGSPVLGSQTDHTFNISNTGGFPASSIVGGGLLPPYEFKGGSYPGTGGSCAGTIAAGSTCSIVVTYSPTVVGVDNDTIEIDYFDGVNSQTATRDITGTGVVPAFLTLSEAPLYDYGTRAVGSNNLHIFTVNNVGGAPATSLAEIGLAAPYQFVGSAYPGTGGDCGTTLGAGASCTLYIEFAPTVIGNYNDQIQLDYFDGAAVQQVTRDVTGNGAAPASLSTSEAPTYDFGNVAIGGQDTHSLIITNSGGVPAVSLSGSTLTLPFDYEGSTYPGLSGDCTATLAPGATCSVSLSFSPTVLATSNDTFTLSYNDGVTGQSVPRDVTGTGVNPAQLAIDQGPTFDYGTLATGSTQVNLFTVSNSGDVTANNIAVVNSLSLPFQYEGGTYPGTSGNCGTSLASGATCSIAVEYGPTATGTHSDTIDIQYDNGAIVTNTTRDVQGNAVDPALLVIDQSPLYNFGSVPTGATRTFIFTMTNTGSFIATGLSGAGLTPPFTYSGGSFPGTGGDCAATLAASSSCQIEVLYSPTNVATHNATMDVNYFDGANNQNSLRDLQGTGVAPALLEISNAPSFNFGTVATGSINTQVLTVTNSGGFQATAIADNLGLAAPFSFSGGSFPGVGGDCAATLASGSTCLIEVSYSPVAPASDSDTIDIAYNNGVSAQNALRDLLGVAVNPAVIDITEIDPYNFGTIATGGIRTHIFTLSNSGGITATGVAEVGLNAPFAFTGGAFPGSNGDCTSSLANGASCDIEIAYQPTVTGTQTDSIEIQYNDGSGSVSSLRQIQGTGAAPAAITITETDPYDFGTLAQGGSATHVFTLTNAGGVDATAMSGGGLGAPFSFTGGSYPGAGGDCGATLVPAATCLIEVEFAPTTAAVFNDTIDINYFDGANNVTSARDITGTGAAPALLTISETNPYNFGLIANGGSVSHSFTISNAGGVPATAVGEVGLAAPFNYLGGSFPGTGGDCGATIGVGASCTIRVAFQPTATGVFPDTIDFTYNNGSAVVNSTRDVQGTATAPASIAISETDPYNYGTRAVGSVTSHIFSLTNSGGVSATAIADAGGLAAPFSYVGGSFPGTAGDCGATLAALASCNIEVIYSPTAAVADTDTIDINYNDGTGATNTTRDVSGTGALPANLSITETDPFDFGSVTVGSSQTHIFTITNGGGVAATAIAEIGLAAPFTFAGGGGFPGAGGTCTASLSAGASCDVVFEFTPAGSGFVSDTIDFSYFDGVNTQNLTRNIQATGLVPATLSISELDPYDYGTRPTGSINQHIFVVTNTGGTQASGMAGAGLNAPFRFEGGSYPGTTGDCAATLAVGASCNLVVEYAPVAVSPSDTDTIDMNYFDGANSQVSSRDLVGVAVTPALLTISESDPYNYGTLATGASRAHSFTISNTGGSQATAIAESTVAAPFRYTGAGNTFPGATGDCGPTLAAGSTCTIEVEYAPTVVNAADSGTITFGYNNGVSVQSVARTLSGVAVTPASITMDQGDPYNYGTVAQGASRNVVITLTNGGGFNATSLTEITLGGDFDFTGAGFPGTGGNCTGTLTSGATCTIEVAFSPSSTGALAGTLSLQYNNGVSVVTETKALNGTGAAPALITISGTDPVDFGTVTQGANTTILLTVNNTGAVNATGISGGGLAAPFGFTGGTYPGLGGTCGDPILPSTPCSIELQFSPTTAVVSNGQVDINYNNGVGPQTTTRTLVGEGVAPALLTISGVDPYDFGTIANGGGIASVAFTINNIGSSSATAINETTLGGDFDFYLAGYPGNGGTCGASLPAGGSCNVVLEFTPTSLGPLSSTFTLQYNDGAAVQTESKALQGVGGAPAILDIASSDPHDFGTQAIGSTNTVILTISNSGAVSATGMAAVASLSPPFNYTGVGYPGTNGTCGTSLATSGTCDIEVQWVPAALGLQSQNISINYNDGTGATNFTHGVQGTGANPAQLAIQGADPADFGNVTQGDTQTLILTVENTGDVNATGIAETGLAGDYAFTAPGTFPGGAGTCTTTITNGSTCTIEVQVTPSSTGIIPGTLTLDYNNGANNTSYSHGLTTNGLAPAVLAITPGPGNYDFGTRPVGSTNSNTFTLTNSGGSAAALIVGGGLSAPFTYSGGSFPGGGTCAGTLASGSSCTFIVDYLPVAANGAESDTLTIDYNDGAAAQQITLGLDALSQTRATLTISESDPYNYGTLATGATRAHSFTISNTGEFQATGIGETTVAAPFRYTGAGNTYPGATGDCGATLAGGATCTIEVEYAPTLVSAGDSGTITFGYNDGVAVQSVARTLSGVAVTPASITMDQGDPYNFGTVAQGASRPVVITLTNGGGFGATSITETTLGGDFDFTGAGFPGTAGNCTTSLLSGASCTIEVEFAPASTGALAGNLTIQYNNGVTTVTETKSLSGSGAAPALITISGTDPVDLGSVTQGSNSTVILTVNNTGAVNATGISGGGLAAPFGFTGGSYPGAGGTCGDPILPSTPCTIEIQFSPTTAVVSNGQVDINYNNGVGPQTTTRTLVGTGVAPALLTLSGADPYDFGTLANGGGIASVTVTVDNIGASSATAMSETTLGGDFDFYLSGYPGNGGTCGASLPAGANCTVVLEFTPTSLGPLASTFTLQYNDGAAVQTESKDLQGVGGAPALLDIATSDPHDFGTRAIGSTNTIVLTVTNGGAVAATTIADAATLSPPFNYTGTGYPGTNGTCGVSLNSGANCDIEVQWVPASTGIQSQNITLNYNDGTGATSFVHGLQGTGANPAQLAIQGADPADFGNVTQGDTQTLILTVENTGSVNATGIVETGLAGDYAFTAPGTFPGGAGTCTTTITNGSTCTIEVQVTPSSTGIIPGTITFDYNNGANNTSYSHGLTTNGLAPAVLAITPGPGNYNFGTRPVGSTNSNTFTLTNSGGSAASSIIGGGLSAPFTYSGGSFPGGGTCTGTLASGSSCTFIVDYLPTVANGAETDTITVDYNDGAAAQQITLGLDAVSQTRATLTISESDPYNYGTLATGATRAHSFTISNTGEFQASAIGESTVAAPFRYTGAGNTYPGAAGDCGATLAGGATCTIEVEYAPTIVSAGDSGTITFGYNDGVAVQSVVRTLSGVAVTPASITMDQTDPYNFGTVAQGASRPVVITLTNGGGFGATSITETTLGGDFDFTGAGFPGTGGNCTASLLSGASCTIEVEFAPTVTGALAGTLTIQYNNGVSTVTETKALSGNGAAPALITISGTDPVDFGSVTQGSNNTLLLTVNNTGAVNATGISGGGLAAPFGFTGGAYPGSAGTCGDPILPSTPCTIELQFSPTTAVVSNGQVDINYNNGVGPQTTTRTLVGTGVAPALLTFSGADPYDFGTIANGGGIASVTVTVDNIGSSSATAMNETTLAGDFDFYLSGYPGNGGTCGASLPAGSNCTVVLEFTPTSLGPLASTFTIQYNDGAAVQTETKDLQGVGGAPALLDIATSDPHNFGTRAIGSNNTVVLTVTNGGAVAATTIADGLSLTPPFDFTGGSYPGSNGTCGASLATGANCDIEVQWIPAATGLQSQNLTLNYNDGTGAATFTHGLQGTGANPALLSIQGADPADFGNVTLADTQTLLLTVENTGGVAATAVVESGLSGDYAFTAPGTFPGGGGILSDDNQ